MKHTTKSEQLQEKLGISDETIELLLDEACRFADEDMIVFCRRALLGDEDAIIEVARVIEEAKE